MKRNQSKCLTLAAALAASLASGAVIAQAQSEDPGAMPSPPGGDQGTAQQPGMAGPGAGMEGDMGPGMMGRPGMGRGGYGGQGPGMMGGGPGMGGGDYGGQAPGMGYRRMGPGGPGMMATDNPGGNGPPMGQSMGRGMGPGMGPGMMHGGGHPMMKRHGMMMKHHGMSGDDDPAWKADLTAEQRARLAQLKLQYWQQKAPLKAQAKAVKVELAVLLGSDQADQGSIDEKINQLVETKRKMLQAKYSYKQQKREVLNPEQRPAFDMHMIQRALQGKKKCKHGEDSGGGHGMMRRMHH